MKLCVVTGSRADYGLLEWPIKRLQEDPFFEVDVLRVWGYSFENAFSAMDGRKRPDRVMVLGDRFEVLAAVTACHLNRIPVAHIAGGDVTEGSYDDAMRDAITRMADIHFVTSTSAMARVTDMGRSNVHLVGSPGIDYIRKADWRKGRPIQRPYVVISYQAETIDGRNEIRSLLETLQDRDKVFILPNKDRGSEAIETAIIEYCNKNPNAEYHVSLPHAEFLNYIAYCDEFIGNSSAMLYEAPELEIKTRMVGKRQRGRTIPWGDGNATERIIKTLKYTA
jgi:UDP-hydrolysing UDP-N-acetyl-D-glucosamine 2-epimerase